MALATIQGLLKGRFAKLPSKRLPSLVAYLIAILFLIWGITPWLTHTSFLKIKVPHLNTTQSSLFSAPAPIEQKHLFGIYVQDYAHLPITTLPLSLQGTMINPTDKQLSTAIISVSSQPGKIFHANQSLPVGAKLIAVHNDYCVLDHGGRLEKLIMPRTTLQNSPIQNSISPDSGLKVVS